MVESPKCKSATIPAEINYYGKKYKVTSVGNYAFEHCSKLKKVRIGKNVVSIGKKAFYNCSSLTSVTIPAKVKNIGKEAFFKCKKLQTLIIRGKNLTLKRIGSRAFKYTYAKMKIRVPKKKMKLYQKVLKKRGVSKRASFRKL